MRPARTGVRPAAIAATVGLLALAACGAAKPADPLSLVQGALSQQYFDDHHALPSNAEENLLARQATGLLNRVYGMPAPEPAGNSPRVDTQSVRAAHGSDAVDEALLAAYILHFGVVPDAYTQSQIAVLSGSSGAPLPIVGKHG